MRTIPSLLFVCLAPCMACGAASPAPGETSHTEHGAHHAHAEHGAHHARAEHGRGHHHDSPDALKPLMRDLADWTKQLKGALNDGQGEAAAKLAGQIAAACDDQQVHDLDPEKFGPDFAAIDGRLHGTAASMARVTAEGDLQAARELYPTLTSACGDCHAQAPSAQHVDLGALMAL